ncbi:MAG: hypothetical protein JF610_12195 [Acidobacteria bacterium]|jgi:hypothetical protein|nr:hypothetical protein [Acidobacteriota bacterium]
MAEQTQSYKNHTRFLPPFHFFIMPVMLVNFLNAGRHVFQQATLHNLWELVFALGLVALALFSRVQALTVQDRIIRLEERLRMRQLLPADLHPHIDTLTHRQLVALRFASDQELADLVRDVVAGQLATPKEIKQRVRNWRPDWLRA